MATEYVFEVWFLNSRGERNGSKGYIYRSTDKVEKGLILDSFRRVEKKVPYGNPAEVTEILTSRNGACESLTMRDSSGAEFEVYEVKIEESHMPKAKVGGIIKSEYGPYMETPYKWNVKDSQPITTDELLTHIGVTSHSSSGELKNVCDVLDEISEKWDKFPKIKEKKKMDFKGMFKNFNLDFGQLHTSGIAVAVNGAIAIRDSAGTYKTYKNGEIMDMTGLTIDEMPLMKMPVALKQLTAGDTIFHNGRVLFVDEVEDGEVLGVDIVGAERVHVLPVKNMFGFNFITKIINPMGTMFGGASEDNPFGSMLPFMLMKDSEDDKSMMMAMMMMGKDGFKMDGGFNPMMLAFMGDGKSDMFETMMIMQMMQGMAGQTKE